jgi:hypothetical protein
VEKSQTHGPLRAVTKVSQREIDSGPGKRKKREDCERNRSGNTEWVHSLIHQIFIH